MKGKIKLLFVVTDFYQAGTERFTYELDRAINKNKFSVDILSLIPLNKSERFKDFYYQKHLELESKIFFINEIDVLRKPTFGERVQRKLFGKPLPPEHQKIMDFFNGYDVISILGEYNYKGICKYLKPEVHNKVLIHIMNSRYQKNDLYVAFPKDRVFHFVSSFSEEQLKWELKEFSEYKHSYFKLNLNLENEFIKPEYIERDNPKIGIFTRLTHTKPLDPFIYSFQLLNNKIPKAELHIFGSGDPEKENVLRYVSQLKLEDKIFFRGHQENILKTAVDENLDIIWLHGYDGMPGGYAGFDICTAKIPQLFWNFGSLVNNELKDIFPMYHNIVDFAKHTEKILKNSHIAKNLAEEQYVYVSTYFDMQKNIETMETLYLKIANNQ